MRSSELNQRIAPVVQQLIRYLQDPYAVLRVWQVLEDRSTQEEVMFPKQLEHFLRLFDLNVYRIEGNSVLFRSLRTLSERFLADIHPGVSGEVLPEDCQIASTTTSPFQNARLWDILSTLFEHVVAFLPHAQPLGLTVIPSIEPMGTTALEG